MKKNLIWDLISPKDDIKPFPAPWSLNLVPVCIDQPTSRFLGPKYFHQRLKFEWSDSMFFSLKRNVVDI